MNIIVLLASLILCGHTFAASSIQINWSTSRDLLNSRISPLSAGTAANGDGALLQLGYYSDATISDPFAGSWITLAVSSIGDAGVNLPGMFSSSTLLTDGNFSAPAAGTPLAVRFFDNTSVANSSFFNAVSSTDGSWNWIQPTEQGPILNLTITKGTSVFLSGVLGDFQTTIPIPEPASVFFAGLSFTLTLCRRNRSLKRPPEELDKQ